jgi:hypothetical protein
MNETKQNKKYRGRGWHFLWYSLNYPVSKSLVRAADSSRITTEFQSHLIGPIGIGTAVDYCNRNIQTNCVPNCTLKLHPIRSQTKIITVYQ